MRRGSVTGPFVMSTTNTPIAQNDARRKLIMFAVDSGVAWITDQPNSATGTGYPVTPSSPLMLSAELHGDLVTHAFYASSPSGTVNVGVIPITGE